MIRSLFITTLALFAPLAAGAELTGAWQHVRPDGATGTMIITDDHISIAWYETDPAKFLYTKGGSWDPSGDEILVTYEFNTNDPEVIGETRSYPFAIDGNVLTLGEADWTRIDDGAPGALEGAWLMTGRKRDGEISTRQPGARRTMKILSGTRFQWIAYNVETKEFFGSGGGTYTTKDGNYTENIEFFSRDDAKAGLSLPFRYELVDGVWHHDGKSTSGNPMYEIWSPREKVGI